MSQIYSRVSTARSLSVSCCCPNWKWSSTDYALCYLLQVMSAFNESSSVSTSNNADYLLRRCWRLQDCYSCLHTFDPCSWCAVSSTCVANEAPIGLLAPIWKPNVCPISDERWELRAKGLGCKVSTFTFLSLLAGILATIAIVLWLSLVVRTWVWLRRRWRKDHLSLHTLRVLAERGWKRLWARSSQGKDKRFTNERAEGEDTRLLA